MAKPTPNDGETLVRIRAASQDAAEVEILRVAFVYRMAAHVKPMHKILGSDVAGQVEVVGRNVSK